MIRRAVTAGAAVIFLIVLAPSILIRKSLNQFRFTVSSARAIW